MGRSSMGACAAALLLLAVLAACGREGDRDAQVPADGNTLHVRVAGMVQADGIT